MVLVLGCYVSSFVVMSIIVRGGVLSRSIFIQVYVTAWAQSLPSSLPSSPPLLSVSFLILETHFYLHVIYAYIRMHTYIHACRSL